MKSSLLLIISLIMFLAAPLLHAAGAAVPSEHGMARREILLLNSYHPGYAWSDDQQAGIIDVLQAKDKTWVPVVEYLDLKRLPDGGHLAELKKLFRRKYQNKKFSAIIAMDNPALEFAVDNQAVLFGNAPIVFCGINNYTPSLLQGRSDITGVVEAIDIAGTIEVMLRLHPDTREIFSPHDYTSTGLAVRKEMEALVPRFGAKVRFRFTDPLTMEELLKEFEGLPKDSLVLEIGFITDKAGNTFDISETTKLFSEHSSVPIYSTYEQRLGFGIVGGKLLSARIHGANAARIALRVLAGEKASAIPVVFESDSPLMFDYKVMSRFGIPLSALPEHSTVINKPVSFYAAHRVVILTALAIIGLLSIIIVLLIINTIHRKRSSEVIRRSEQLFKVIASSTPDHLIVQDSDLRYSFVINPQPGLTQKDMIGKTDHDFLSKEDADNLTEIKREVLKNGTPVHTEVSLMSSSEGQQFFSGSYIPKFDAKGKIDGLIGYFRNVTERKRAGEAQRQSEENFHRSLDDSPLGVRIVTEEGETIYANRAILAIYGYDSTEELNTNPVKNRYTPESYADYQIRKEKRKQGDYYPSEYDISIVRKDGEVRHLQVFRKEVLWDGERQFQVLYQDITGRKKAGEALRESEARFRGSVENMLDAFGLYSAIRDQSGQIVDFQIEYINAAACASNQMAREAQIGERLCELLPAHRETGLFDDYCRVVETGSQLEKVSLIYEDVYGKERLARAFDIRASKLGDGFVATWRDVTERQRVEEALRESEARYREMTDSITDVFFEMDQNLLYTYWNKASETLTGIPARDAIGKSLRELFPDSPETRKAEAVYLDVIRTQQPQTFENAYQAGEKRVVFYVSVYPSSRGISVFTKNITERKKAEDELRASREQMRALAGRLQAVREEERTQIAREIHDELGGTLTGLKIDCSLMAKSALKIENEAVRASLIAGMDSMTALINSTIHTVRRIAMELRPGILDDLGLVAALEWQLKDFEKRTGIRCGFFPPAEDIDLDANCATAVFRIFQEALTNVARHSGATEVHVFLCTGADSCTLEVEDNGKGIEKEQTLGSRSLGLLGMRERAQMFGGRVTVTGTPGRGTRVMVEIPVVEKKEMDREGITG